MNSMKDNELPDGDPGEYLLTNTKYHDCHITIGDPATEQVEVVGVTRSALVSQSTVFREMLEESELADPTGENTHITDVSPPIFKLMLRYMYRGHLPKMNQETAAQLVICADKYNIEPLVNEASCLLAPKTVEDVFPALRCVAYLTLPDLYPRVSAIVQEHTDKLVKSQEFLELDDHCLEFVTQQEGLVITEVELWKSLVRWVQHQTGNKSDLRKKLTKPLKHVRFLTFSQDEIIREVVPTNILSNKEIVDLLSAIANGQSLVSPNLCKIKVKRNYGKSNKKSDSSTRTPFTEIGVFKSNIDRYGKVGSYHSGSTKSQKSYFAIKTCKDVILQSFTVKSRLQSQEKGQPFYILDCNISVHKVEKGLEVNVQQMKFKRRVLCDEDVSIPLYSRERDLFLAADTFYKVVIEFSSEHPVYQTTCSVGFGNTTEEKPSNDNVIKVKFDGYIHVKEIEYKW